MQHVFFPAFVLVAVTAVAALDYHSARRTDPDLSLSDYAEKRMAAVFGPSADAPAPADAPAVVTATDPGAPAPAGSVLSLATGALAMLAGRGSSAAPAEPGIIDPTASPEEMSKQAGAVFAGVAAAIATGDKEALFSSAEVAAPGGSITAPKPSMMRPATRLTDKSCGTRAGTKFCSVAAPEGN